MRYRKLSASYVFTLSGAPLKNGMVVTDSDGTVVEVIDTADDLSESEGVEHYSGILCPGFINAHCHLELSHLKGKIAEHGHLPEFLHQIMLLRNVDEGFQEMTARQADRFMWMNGIVAVGDVANGTSTIEIKENSKIDYHTFIECFGFLPEKAPRAMEYAGFAFMLYDASRLKASIVPHSPYSVSNDLFELLAADARGEGSIVTIHHQESAEEDQMFLDKSGGMIDHYANDLKLDTTFWQPTGKSSTHVVIDKIPAENQLLLVHNTFADKDDLALLREKRSTGNTFLVTCPNANLYIEDRLPDYELLRNSGFRICLGTDSLASNHTLSILEEMKTIGNAVPDLSLEELLTWACVNGAAALRISDWAGSIEVGKKPGINLIGGADLRQMKLMPGAKVRRMV
ncbi:MAG TPA: amidohydrolase family protein [Prolixibacteraceae bacterium]|nr:amidohydrolase family protein [Prolixibacteraceae bacterium]HPS12412.1 amidohydrolase family protein [Prolixibacteraceae bacterium]